MKNIRKIGIYLLLILLVSSLLVGCGSKKQVDENLQGENLGGEELGLDYPMEIRDPFGNLETIEEEPKKIVSLAPHNTEILFSLGLGEKVVGVTTYCDYPEEARAVEKIGSYGEFNLERIVELEPDLVLVYGRGNEDENKTLRNAGIKVLGFQPESIDEVIEDMRTLGRITGSNEEAVKLTNSMIEKKNEIIEKIRDEEKVRVFYEIWHEPLQAAGEGSFIGELLTLAGGENTGADGDIEENMGGYPIFDLEQLIEKNPEVYLTSGNMPEKDIESIKDRPGYEEISAIKNNRIYIFEGDEANIVSRPGPRIVEALEIIAKSIHPEIFK